jgi:hypothetical protein
MTAKKPWRRMVVSWCHDGPCYASYRDCLPQRGKRVVSHETRVIVGHVEKRGEMLESFPSYNTEEQNVEDLCNSHKKLGQANFVERLKIKM